MIKEFKEFIVKGNVADMAVGIVIGASFGKIVNSFVTDILTPPLGLLMGRLDFSNLFVTLSGAHYATLAEAKAAGAPTLNYGIFLNAVIDFLIVGFAIFLLVRQMNKLRRQPQPPPPDTRECPQCASSISNKAKRCPQCTSQLV